MSCQNKHCVEARSELRDHINELKRTRDWLQKRVHERDVLLRKIIKYWQSCGIKPTGSSESCVYMKEILALYKE